MRGQFSSILRALRYGRPVIVVSGLPRSGTSMLMSMLSAGGLPLIADHQRVPDRNNPKGYFEDDRVMSLGSTADKSWLREARGKGIKVISHLLQTLPADNYYRIVLARRDLDEIIESQNKMLAHRGEENPIDDEETRKRYAQHLKQVHTLASVRRNFELLEVNYAGVVESPQAWAAKIAEFVGLGIDPNQMRDIVDERLYRNRRHKELKR